MTDSQSSFDFEQSWQGKLRQAVRDQVGPEAAERVLAGGQELSDASKIEERIRWTCGALGRLEQAANPRQEIEILNACACRYPEENLADVRQIYRETGDIDQALIALQEIFERFLREDLKLEENLVGEVVSRNWGLAGVRRGATIIATKIPKSGSLRDYFHSQDPEEKRRLYCHCPRIRDGIGRLPRPREVYCQCGAGFYRGIWETILERPVRVEVLDSVLAGGDVCRVAVQTEFQQRVEIIHEAR